MPRDVFDAISPGEAYSPIHRYEGPIVVDDTGVGETGIKLGTVELPDSRTQIVFSALAPSFELSVGGNISDFYVVAVPEGVDPFDSNLILVNSLPAATITFSDSDCPTGTVVARSAQQGLEVFPIAGLTLVPVTSIDIWITHPDAIDESLTLTDGVEVYVG